MTMISVEVYRILALKKGLEFYAKTGVQVNRLWTPKGMMRTAEQITGRKFKPRDYKGAAKALDQLIR